jgi:hypothetical protein
MDKRYIRIDIEYVPSNLTSFVVANIKRILSEDMPYCKVIFTRDTPNKEELNKEVKYPGV